MTCELHFRLSEAPSRRFLLGLALLAALAAPARAQPVPSRPRLPPGRDPGPSAIPFAVVDSGIDYRDPAIAQRLARDGEGGLVGWDDEARDTLPYDRPFPAGAGPALGTALARIVLAEAGASRLVPVRRHPTDPLGIARGISFAARTPARVVLLGHVPPGTRAWTACREATAHYPQLLVVAGAGGPGGAPPAGARDIANMLVVAPAEAQAAGSDGSGPAVAEVAIPWDAATGPPTAPTIPPALAAAARATALALRLFAASPDLAGATLKARILSHAEPMPAGPGLWLPRAKRQFWLE